MGVPAFFRWLQKKYPKIISEVIEEPSTVVDGVDIPADYRGGNPNGELDNLYLDMNGIVHPCTHPEGRPAPENEDEMMLEVFRYTDRVVRMARPRKLLMIAVDGVAPRAKMNQQRSRRFRSAMDAKISAEAKEHAISEAEARGQMIDDAIKDKKQWDSNAITPGTPFMDILAQSLRYWISYKLNNDPGWQDLKVIISDATVPGEGEHKIMEFIRSQRCDPSYDPNTSHCMYGLDADLIFLGLATHEPHFRILREDVFAQDKKKRPNGFNFDRERAQREEQFEKEQESKKSFIWLHVDILRQYLEVELYVPRLPFPFDFERAIDDWIFMCFFVGNDFLPHLPCLDVRDNSIDLLLSIWKNALPKMGGYMTCDGKVNLARVETVIQALGSQEEGIFRKRRNQEVRRMENEKRRRQEREADKQRKRKGNSIQGVALSKSRGERAPVNPLENMPLYTTSGESVGSTHMSNSDLVANRNALNLANMANKSAADDLRAKLLMNSTEVASSQSETAEEPTNLESEPKTEVTETVEIEKEAETPDTSPSSKRKAEAQLEKAEDAGFDEPEDNIKLWEPGFRDRYYANKFHVSPDDKDFRRQVVSKYIEGVCWVLLYYYQGCASWTWFYPYHYAPFAADFVNLSDIDVKFDKGKPFRPFEQLMSVMPASSAHTLPDKFHPLMSSPDSEIIDFYPEEFPIDMNGKKMSWQGIALLPFIDEKRLLTAVSKVYEELTEAETARNTNRDEVLIIGSHNKLAPLAKKMYDESTHEAQFTSEVGGGLAGKIDPLPGFKPGADLQYPLKSGEDIWPELTNNQAIAMEYHMPELMGYHKSMLLSGVKLRENVLTYEDRDAVLNGGRNNNRYGSHGGGYNGNYSNPGERAIPKPKRGGGYEYFIHNGPPTDSSNQGYHGNRNNRSSYRGGHHQNNGGYNNGGYNNGGYNNGGYNNGGYNNGGHNNGGYNNGGYNNGGYNNNRYQGRQNYNRGGNHGNSQGYQGYGQGSQGYNHNYNRQGQQNYNQGYGNDNYTNNHNQGNHLSGELPNPRNSGNYQSRGPNQGFSYR